MAIRKKKKFHRETKFLVAMWYIIKQLFTSVLSESGGYLPRHFMAR